MSLYPEELNLDGTTKHSRYCKACFGRFDLRCHRCLELKRGARSRSGWQPKYFTTKRNESQRRFPW